MWGKGDETTNIIYDYLIFTTELVQEIEKQISDVAILIKFTTPIN